jgi:hypothetical protein
MSKYSPQGMNFFNPYKASNFGQNMNTPYMQDVNTTYRNPMLGGEDEQQLYPLESGTDTDYLNSNVSSVYAAGGQVNIPDIASLLEQYGEGTDNMLAHINPLEAMILEGLGGSGDINPNTGLRQYVMDPGTIAALISGAGSLLGAFTGKDDDDSRHEKDDEDEEEEYLPDLASLLNSGQDFSDYEALRRNLRKGTLSGEFARGGAVDPYQKYLDMLDKKEKRTFGEKLADNSSDYFSDPGVLVGLAGTAARYFGEKKKPAREGKQHKERQSPEEKAMEIKAFNRAMQLSEGEIENEAQYQQMVDYQKWLARNNLRKGETLQTKPMFRKENDHEEFQRNGKRFGYYDNPAFTGQELYMKEGGNVNLPLDLFGVIEKILSFDNMHDEPSEHELKDSKNPLIVMIIESGNAPLDEDNESRYFEGDGGGQDDTIPAKLSDGEYVIDASTVSDLGDGNNKAGAIKLDKFRENIRRSKRGGNIDLPPKTKNLEDYFYE